jgi:hypothetical protein
MIHCETKTAVPIAPLSGQLLALEYANIGLIRHKF